MGSWTGSGRVAADAAGAAPNATAAAANKTARKWLCRTRMRASGDQRWSASALTFPPGRPRVHSRADGTSRLATAALAVDDPGFPQDREMAADSGLGRVERGGQPAGLGRRPGRRCRRPEALVVTKAGRKRTASMRTATGPFVTRRRAVGPDSPGASLHRRGISNFDIIDRWRCH